MADKFQTVASGVGILKNFYQGPIKDQLSEDLPIYRAAEKVKKGWSGAQVNRPLRLQRNQGIGAVADGGTLPSVGRQGQVQATILAKYNYLRFGLTGPMIAASQLPEDDPALRKVAELAQELGAADVTIRKLRGALEAIAALETGSRGAYSKFAHAQSVARRALGLFA